MIAVIFEVLPNTNREQDYLNAASALGQHLGEIDGFISIERFKSLTHPGKILSLSFWRDEEAIKQWRTFEPHRSAQKDGRREVFADYRLRVTTVIRDYGMNDRREAPSNVETRPYQLP